MSCSLWGTSRNCFGFFTFLIHINDLPLHVSNKVRLDADDIILYSNIHSIEDCHSLQNDLNSLMVWSHKWQMHFYPRKREFLRITNKKLFLSFSYYINGCLIQEVLMLDTWAWFWINIFLGTNIPSKLQTKLLKWMPFYTEIFISASFS